MHVTPDAVIGWWDSRTMVALRSAARAIPGGWLYHADPHLPADGDIPPHALVGAWRVDDNGAITAEFRANLAYQPSPRTRGWALPADELDDAVQRCAAGYATRDDVIAAFLRHRVAYAIAENGSLVRHGPGRVIAYSQADRPPAQIPFGASWQRSTGRLLVMRAALDADVLVNPGPWQALLPAAMLAARAGGEASGDQLVERMEEFLAGELDGRALHAAFCCTQVFCQAHDPPGFIALGEGTDRYVPVFTSLVALARVAGQTPWFATTGQEVLDLLPDGYDIVLDAGAPYAIRLSGAATEQRIVEPGRG